MERNRMSVSSVGKPVGLPPSYVIMSMPTPERSLSWTLILLNIFYPLFMVITVLLFIRKSTLRRLNSLHGVGGSLFPTATVELVAWSGTSILFLPSSHNDEF